MAPIFTGPAVVGVGVAVGVSVDVGVGTSVTVVVGVGVGVLSSSPPPQAGSRMSSNKLKAVNTANHRFMKPPVNLVMCRVAITSGQTMKISGR